MNDKETLTASARMSTMSGLTCTTTSTSPSRAGCVDKVSSSFMTNSTIATTTAAYIHEDDEDEYFRTEEDDNEEEDCLPFALPEEQYETVLEKEGSVLISSPLYNSNSNSNSSSSNSRNYASAASSSSMIQTSLQSELSPIPSYSLVEENDSIILSTAASISAAADEVLQHACGSLMPASSSHDDSTIKNTNLLDFSQLMREADDTIEDEEKDKNNTTQETIITDGDSICDDEINEKEGITIVPASPSSDDPMACNRKTTTENENTPQDGLWGYLFGGEKNISSDDNECTAPLEAALSMTAPVQQSMRSDSNPPAPYHYHSPQQHYTKNQVKAVQTSPSSFRLSTTIPLRPQLTLTTPSSSNSNSSSCSSVREVIDIIANPDLLKIWCDSISCILLIESIGNDQTLEKEDNANNAKNGNREYDGEWIKVTTSTLIPPNSNSSVYNPTSCLSHSCVKAKAYLGFPTHGDVTMFVERSRGQVGVTIGPFPDSGIVVSHTITVYSCGENSRYTKGAFGVEIVDHVRISREGEEYDETISSSGSGVVDATFCSGCLTRSCCEPRIVGHMNQAISSLEKLCVLIELGGETAAFGGVYNTTATTTSEVAAPLLMCGNRGNSCGRGILLGMERDDGRTPLLG